MSTSQREESGTSHNSSGRSDSSLRKRKVLKSLVVTWHGKISYVGITFLSISLSFSIERRHGDGGSGSESGGESRRMYKSRSVISSESESDEEPSPADKKKTHPSKDTKKGLHVYFYV